MSEEIKKWENLEGKENKTVAPYPTPREIDVDSLSGEELEEFERRENLVKLLISKIPQSKEKSRILPLDVNTQDVDVGVTTLGNGTLEVHDRDNRIFHYFTYGGQYEKSVSEDDRDQKSVTAIDAYRYVEAVLNALNKSCRH